MFSVLFVAVYDAAIVYNFVLKPGSVPCFMTFYCLIGPFLSFKHFYVFSYNNMYISIQKNASYNSVKILDSKFVECKATLGCGGIDIDSTKRSPSLNNNAVVMNNSVFIKNDATKFGGGTCVFTFPFETVTKNDRFAQP